MDETVDFIFATDDAPIDAGGPYITYANAAFARYVGYSREELLGVSPAAFFGPETDAEALSRLRADMRALRTAASELLVYRKDGSTFWAEFVGRPLFEGGVFRGWIAVGRDIELQRRRMLSIATKGAAVEAARDPVVVYDASNPDRPVIEYVNPAFSALFGYTAEEVVGREADALYGASTNLAQIRYMRAALLDGLPARGTVAMYGKSLEPRTIELNVNPVKEDDRVVRWVAVLRDVTSQHEYRESIVAQKRRLHATLRCVATPLLLMNADERIEFANSAAERLFGRDWTTMYGLLLSEAIQLSPIRQDAESSPAHMRTYRATHERSGERLILDVTISPVSDEGADFGQYLVAFDDVTADVAAHRRLTYDAMHDPLTGLLNRRGFDVVMKAAMTSASPGDPSAIALIDLDGFKPLNDRHGHAAGDRYLLGVAEVLRGKLRRGDEVARFGGDEFVVFLAHCTEAAAERIGESLRRAIEDLRVDWNGSTLNASASYGCAALPFESTFTEALKLADERLYTRKKRR